MLWRGGLAHQVERNEQPCGVMVRIKMAAPRLRYSFAFCAPCRADILSLLRCRVLAVNVLNCAAYQFLDEFVTEISAELGMSKPDTAIPISTGCRGGVRHGAAPVHDDRPENIAAREDAVGKPSFDELVQMDGPRLVREDY
jgi:hypothetical protein